MRKIQRRLPKTYRKRAVTTISIDYSILDRTHEFCKEKGISVSALINNLLIKYIEKTENRKKVEALQQKRLLVLHENLRDRPITDMHDFNKYTSDGYSEEEVFEAI